MSDTTTRCPHCGAEPFELPEEGFKCGTEPWFEEEWNGSCLVRSSTCYSNENNQLKRELEKLEAEVARLTEALVSCLHITNVYDGNYSRACDHVQIIVSNALKKIANPETKLTTTRRP